MSNVDEFIGNFLSHEAEPYDPAARREYYLRTRQLKGRRPAAVKPVIGTRTKVVKPISKKAKKDKRSKSEKIQDKAQARAKAIVDRLKAWNEFAGQTTASEMKRIGRETQAKIDALPPIPKNVNPATRARLARARAQDIAQIRGQGKSKQEKIRKEFSGQQKAKQDKTKAQLKQVQSELKSALKKARADLKDEARTNSNKQTASGRRN